MFRATPKRWNIWLIEKHVFNRVIVSHNLSESLINSLSEIELEIFLLSKALLIDFNLLTTENKLDKLKIAGFLKSKIPRDNITFPDGIECTTSKNLTSLWIMVTAIMNIKYVPRKMKYENKFSFVWFCVSWTDLS